MLFDELAFASNPLDKGFRFHFQYNLLMYKGQDYPYLYGEKGFSV